MDMMGNLLTMMGNLLTIQLLNVEISTWSEYLDPPMNSLRTLVLSSSSSLATMIQLMNAISVVLYGTRSAILSSFTIRLKRYLCFFSVCYLWVEEMMLKMTICKKTQRKITNLIFYLNFYFLGGVGVGG